MNSARIWKSTSTFVPAPANLCNKREVVTHARYVIFQMAEVAVPRELFAAILDRIQRFGVPPPLVQRG